MLVIGRVVVLLNQFNQAAYYMQLRYLFWDRHLIPD